MSNKTDMQTQLDRQAALIDTLRGKAVGGSSGSGATVETCTLTINYIDGSGYGMLFNGYICSTYENGSMSAVYIDGWDDYQWGDKTVVIQNVVNNTPIYIMFEAAGIGDNEISTNNCTILHMPLDYATYCVIYTHGDNAEITIIAN